MEEGTVLRVAGGFFRVLLPGGRIVETKPRGRLRKGRVSIIAGDRVQVTLSSAEEGVIEGVSPRRTELLRPAVANIDLVVAVMAIAEPPPNFGLLDRLLVLARFSGMSCLVLWTKADLDDGALAKEQMDVYRRAGYDVLLTSARTGQGIQQLAAALAGRISTLAGPSGVGKSALLNALHPGWKRTTGEVSRRLGRGRHTTRQVELLPLPTGGLVADTPGFSTLDLRAIPKEELGSFMPDVDRFAGQCRFPGCLHRHEPDCAVAIAVDAGDIHRRRYHHYIQMLNELEQWEARRYS